MALSGKQSKGIISNVGLDLEWSGSQNIAGNYTAITAVVYLRTGAYDYINAGTVGKAIILEINGNSKKFSNNITIGTGSRRELARYTVNVPHNADGTKSVTIATSVQFDITYSGTQLGTSTFWNTYALNTIPRGSKGSASNFVFTNNCNVSISRASSSFKHVATLYVDGTYIKQLSNLGASGTFSFTDDERKKIVQKMGNRTSVKCSVFISTWNNGTRVPVNGADGYTAYCYVTAPTRASGTVANFTISTSGFPVKLSGFNSNSKFSYKGIWDFKSFSKTATLSSASPTFPLTTTDVDGMLTVLDNATSIWGTLTIRSYYDGVQFGGDYAIKPIQAYINTSVNKPSIVVTTTYKDTNTTTVNLTKSDQIIISNLSIISVSIPANLAKATTGAKLASTKISLGGSYKEFTYSDSATTISLGTINATSNSNLIVTVTDSRGVSTSWTKPVTIVDYKKPTIEPNMQRVNHYDNDIKVQLAGTYSLVTIGGQNKNSITYAKIRYKSSPKSDIWSADKSLSYVASNGKLTSNEVVALSLDNSLTWYVQIEIGDTFGSKVIYEGTISEGKPILFLDSKLKSVGVGKFPTEAKTLELASDYTLETNNLEANYIAANIGFKSILIPSNSDLNNYKTSGFFYNPANAQAETITNLPVKKSFSLLVEQHAGVKQTLTTYESTYKVPWSWIRNYYNGVWSDWAINSYYREGVVSPASGFSMYTTDASSSSYPKVIRVDNQVTIYGALKNNSAISSGASVKIGNLPTWARPFTFEYRTQQGSGAARWLFRIDPDGELYLDRYSNPGYVSAAAGSWLIISSNFMARPDVY